MESGGDGNTQMCAGKVEREYGKVDSFTWDAGLRRTIYDGNLSKHHVILGVR